ncbi:MAG: hypothetical protein AB7P03_10535 [Kofleriaceae bacterium]
MGCAAGNDDSVSMGEGPGMGGALDGSSGSSDQGDDPAGGEPIGGDEPVDTTNPSYPMQHPRIYLTANAARLKAALADGRPAATRFRSIADNWVNGADIYEFKAWNAALLGQLTGDPKYCNAAVADIEAQVSSAESAISSGQRPVVAADSYLYVGDMIGDLALVYDWCFSDVTASQRQRWLAYANQAVWNVWHPSQAKWGSTTYTWSGWATDDPSNNYYYSFLRATMLLGLASNGESPQASDWIEQFRETKVLGQLVPTFNDELVGGGSREGTGYGVAMRGLWQLYDFWAASTGERLSSKTSHTKSSMLAFMHQIVPTLDRVAPTGDHARDSSAALFDYHRSYLQELVAIYQTDPVARRAQTILDSCSVPRMSSSFMAVDDFLYDTDVSAMPIDLNTNYYASGIGELYSRSSWDTDATWVNLIAGPYTQSHAHQDQGSIMVFKGDWLAYDANIHSHSGLRQETTAHSLVRIDSGGSPVRQVARTESSLVALHSGGNWLYAAADVTPAYDGNTAIGKVHREIVFLKPNVVVVFDRVTSAAGTQQVWQLATPAQPSISGSKATISGAHSMTVQRLAPSTSWSVHNMTSDSDFSGGYRLEAQTSGGDQRYLHVLSIDGAVQSATAANDSTVTVTTASGNATIAFNRDEIGATLTYGGATTTLGPGIDAQAP